jgi:hypothetical protein
MSSQQSFRGGEIAGGNERFDVRLAGSYAGGARCAENQKADQRNPGNTWSNATLH